MQALSKVNQRTATSASGSSVSILALSGDISSTSKDAVLGAYHRLDTSVSKLLLDFSAVDYINSSGIAIVIQMLLETTKVSNRSVGIFGLSAHFHKVFTMVGISKYAALHNNQAAALESL